MNKSNPNLSRRQFALLTAAGLSVTGAVRSQTGELTARQVIERIQKNVGVPWRPETVDTFKAGNPDTPVKGIATTVMATLDVLQRASAAGKNLIITHEPTFYNHLDETKDFGDDPVVAFKQDFIKKNRMVVWRFHDHWHARKPDGVLRGMADSLGWEKYRSPENQRLFVLPGTTLDALAKDIRGRLKIRTIRVIGDPQTTISKVAFNPGFANLTGVMRTLARPEVDALVIGESREWEGIVEKGADHPRSRGLRRERHE